MADTPVPLELVVHQMAVAAGLAGGGPSDLVYSPPSPRPPLSEVEEPLVAALVSSGNGAGDGGAAPVEPL